MTVSPDTEASRAWIKGVTISAMNFAKVALDQQVEQKGRERQAVLHMSLH